MIKKFGDVPNEPQSSRLGKRKDSAGDQDVFEGDHPALALLVVGACSDSSWPIRGVFGVLNWEANPLNWRQ